jgi:hypothetical protein
MARSNIYRTEELTMLTPGELLSLPGIGRKCLAEIERYVQTKRDPANIHQKEVANVQIA